MRLIEADGQASDGTASSVTLYTGAGTELDSYVTISDGATGTVTVDGTWSGRLTIGHYDKDSVKTEATVTVNGTWSGDAHSLGSNNSLTLNLNGVWDPGYDDGIMARNDDSDAAGSTFFSPLPQPRLLTRQNPPTFTVSSTPRATRSSRQSITENLPVMPGAAMRAAAAP